MKSEEDPTNGSQDTAEKVHCFPGKVSLIIDPSQRNLLRLYSICVKSEELNLWEISPTKRCTVLPVTEFE